MAATRKGGKAPASKARTAAKPAKSQRKTGAKRPAVAARAPARSARPGKGGAPRKRAAAAPRPGPRAGAQPVDPTLFDPLTEGERADALRILVEDRRLAGMAKVARYRVVSSEPLVVKHSHPRFGRRLARTVVYDYSALRSVDALVDLDEGTVGHLQITAAQPALAREEEAAAVAIALADERVGRELGLNDEPQAALHYWSRRDTDLAFTRRSAAVLFGQPDARPSLVAVVDLSDGQVTDVVVASEW
jgi:hypothetical protein